MYNRFLLLSSAFVYFYTFHKSKSITVSKMHKGAGKAAQLRSWHKNAPASALTSIMSVERGTWKFVISASTT